MHDEAVTACPPAHSIITAGSCCFSGRLLCVIVTAASPLCCTFADLLLCQHSPCSNSPSSYSPSSSSSNSSYSCCSGCSGCCAAAAPAAKCLLRKDWLCWCQCCCCRRGGLHAAAGLGPGRPRLGATLGATVFDLLARQPHCLPPLNALLCSSMVGQGCVTAAAMRLRLFQKLDLNVGKGLESVELDLRLVPQSLAAVVVSLVDQPAIQYLTHFK